jgi:hypothetical protein
MRSAGVSLCPRGCRGTRCAMRSASYPRHCPGQTRPPTVDAKNSAAKTNRQHSRPYLRETLSKMAKSSWYSFLTSTPRDYDLGAFPALGESARIRPSGAHVEGARGSQHSRRHLLEVPAQYRRKSEKGLVTETAMPEGPCRTSNLLASGVQIDIFAKSEEASRATFPMCACKTSRLRSRRSFRPCQHELTEFLV